MMTVIVTLTVLSQSCQIILDISESPIDFQ